MDLDDKATAERIRSAALRLFATRGYEGTGIRDVARDAGISTASLYHYMGGKQDLLLDIIRSGMQELRDTGELAVQTASTPSGKLAAITRSHVRFHGRHQLQALVSDGELRILTGPARATAIKLRDDYEELWADVLADGLERGDFQLKNPKVVRLALLQMCTGVAYWFTATGDQTLDEIADEFADLALAMVRSPVTPSSLLVDAHELTPKGVQP
jgi:AcrR family transcriptional regulator